MKTNVNLGKSFKYSENLFSELAVLAKVAQSHSSQSSLPDLIGEQNGGNGGADCPCEEDEEMPSLEDADTTEL